MREAVPNWKLFAKPDSSTHVMIEAHQGSRNRRCGWFDRTGESGMTRLAAGGIFPVAGAEVYWR